MRSPRRPHGAGGLEARCDASADFTRRDLQNGQIVHYSYEALKVFATYKYQFEEGRTVVPFRSLLLEILLAGVPSTEVRDSDLRPRWRLHFWSLQPSARGRWEPGEPGSRKL